MRLLLLAVGVVQAALVFDAVLDGAVDAGLRPVEGSLDHVLGAAPHGLEAAVAVLHRVGKVGGDGAGVDSVGGDVGAGETPGNKVPVR